MTGKVKIPASQARILVIDDDSLVGTTLELQITKSGFKVLLALSGEQAIELVRIKKIEFDLAIIDYNMPTMNGIQTFIALRKLLPNFKAILYTGNPNIDELNKQCPDGLVCLAKDFDCKRLLTLIENLISRR